MKRYLFSLVVWILAVPVSGQDTHYSIFSYRNAVPDVRINTHALTFQENVAPSLYTDRSARTDLAWVEANDSTLVDFWSRQGNDILHILRELSGIPWVERSFDIYLVRYFPSIGSGDPLILALGGIVDGSRIEAAPDSLRLEFGLIYLLAHRMLDQATQPEDSIVLSISAHPLMRPGPFRRDNLALTLALATALNVMGVEPALAAYESAFWKRTLRGREIFEKYFRTEWSLSPNQTLAKYLAEEPYYSERVTVTKPPRPASDVAPPPRNFVEGLPLRGDLGVSFTINDRSQLVVDKVDVFRVAYACGLRIGDVVRRVDGTVVRTHRELVEQILVGYDQGGAVVEIMREGVPLDVIIQPVRIDPWLIDDLPGDSLGPADSTGGVMGPSPE